MTFAIASKTAALALAAVVGATAAATAAAPVAPAAAAKPFVVTKAAIEAGRLVIAGVTSKPKLTVALKGTKFKTTSAANGLFTFSVDLLPPGCRVVLGSTGGTIGVQVANCGLKGAVGNAGPAGAPGLPGAAGPQGPQGPQGQIGAEGAQGLTGAQGSQGPQGEIGREGDVGPTGPQGPKGDTGSFAGQIFDASIASDGTLLRGSNGVVAGRTGLGTYILSFPRDVRACTTTASIAEGDGFSKAALPFALKVLPGIASPGGLNSQLSVRANAWFTGAASTFLPLPADAAFNLQVICL